MFLQLQGQYISGASCDFFFFFFFPAFSSELVLLPKRSKTLPMPTEQLDPYVEEKSLLEMAKTHIFPLKLSTMIVKIPVQKCAHQSGTFDRFGTCNRWSASRNLPFSKSSNQKRRQMFPSDSKKISHSKLAIALCGPSFGEAFDWNEASFEIFDPNEPQIAGFDAEFASSCCCIEGLRF